MLSHGNSLDFGLMGDMHSLPDLEFVAERMLARFEELETAVNGKARRKKTTRAGTRSKAKGKKAAPKAPAKKAAGKTRRKTGAKPKTAARRASR